MGVALNFFLDYRPPPRVSGAFAIMRQDHGNRRYTRLAP
jgi:hypothetical protein